MTYLSVHVEPYFSKAKKVNLHYHNERKMYFEIAHKMSTTAFALIVHLIKAAGTDL